MSVADKLQTLQNIKTDIKTSILNKGVDVNDDFTTYANAINNIETGGGSGGDTPNYSYLSNTVDEDGLRALGWDDESIGYFKDNTLHYEWQNDDYTVSEENKSLYGVVNESNISSFKNNPNFIFCPLIDFSKSYTFFFKQSPYLKGVPKFSNFIQPTMNYTFAECPELLTLPVFDTSKITEMVQFVYNCRKLKSFPPLDTSKVNNMTQMFLNCSSLETIPLIDTGNVTSMQLMFGECSNLKKLPLLNTSKVTNMSQIFYNCSNLDNIPHFNTANVTDMSSMFNGCSKIKTIPHFNTANVINMSRMFQSCSLLTTIPQLNTSNVNDMVYMFYVCSSLTTIPEIDTSNVTNMNNMFTSCSKLTSLPRFNVANVTSISTYFGYSNITTLTDVGGWENLKINWNDNYGLAKLPNLTYQSCINILNGLYDFTGNGETPTSSQGKLKVHSNFLKTVGDEISIGTNKGWTITA